MNLDFRGLLDQLAKAPGRAKLSLALSVLAIVAALAVGGYLSGQPHYTTLYSELSDHERVAVEKALAGAGVSFRVSPFPGPYAIYVDDKQYDQAQIAVALAEALKQPASGIDASTGGAATIFMSAGERAQSMQKREWQEAERLLEHLDFVTDSTVTTSMPESSPLRAKKPVMVSVALELKGALGLEPEQARNVAKLVMYRFGVPAENVMITDAAGRTLYDPASLEDSSRDVRTLFEHSSNYDTALETKALQALEKSYGPGKAVVTVTSQWNYDQSTIIDDKLDPEAVAVETELRSTNSPSGSNSGVGGAAGVASSVAGFGNENAAAGSTPSGAASNAATTKDERKVFQASRQRTQTVRSTPKLERLSVSLVLDESLGAKQQEIQRIVEAAVGFDKQRQDVIGVTTTAFVTEKPEEAVGEEGEAAEGAATTDEGPSRMLEMLLERGVEIASALVFLFLLITSLKGSKKGGAAAPSTVSGARSSGGGGGGSSGGSGGESGDASVDPEVLARAQIEELVRTDPRRVGEILSRWIDEKSTAKV
jgi:flagellar M-ring protein FliF